MYVHVLFPNFYSRGFVKDDFGVSFRNTIICSCVAHFCVWKHYSTSHYPNCCNIFFSTRVRRNKSV